MVNTVSSAEDSALTSWASVANCTTENNFSAGKFPSELTMIEENSLTLAKLVQQVSSLTDVSLHSEAKPIVDRNVAPGQETQSDPSPSLQTEPDMSIARQILKSLSLEHIRCEVG